MIAQQAWDEFLETATANGSTENGAIDLYDIDGMVEAAHDLFKMAEAAEAKVARLVAALTPSGDTKAEYSGEFSISVYGGTDDDGAEIWRQVLVDWTTIKSIMATIFARAALSDIKEPSHD